MDVTKGFFSWMTLFGTFGSSSSKFFFEEVSLLGGKAANDSNAPGSERPHQRQQVCYGCVTRPEPWCLFHHKGSRYNEMDSTSSTTRWLRWHHQVYLVEEGRGNGADLKSFTFFPPRSREDLCWLRKRISLKRQELSASDQEELDQLQKRSMAANVI